MMMRAMAADFYSAPTHLLARSLLGKILMHGQVGGRVVEVEAYQGPSDRAAHSFGGRPTQRTRVMYGPAGMAYIYLIYGMYTCLNVVSGGEGRPEAILIRGLEPLYGVDTMARRRGQSRNLTNGPGRLTQALDIDRSLNGHCLWRYPLFLSDDGFLVQPSDVRQGPRVGVEYAGVAAKFPWRYWIDGHRSVSTR